MSETLKPSATGKAVPGRSFSPGSPSLESKSGSFKSFSGRPSFEGARVTSLSPLRNRIAVGDGETKSAPRISSNAFKPFNPSELSQLRQSPKIEAPKTTERKSLAPKSSDPKPDAPKGSERFAKLGKTQEYRFGRNADPLDRQVHRTEVAKMAKVVEAPKTKTIGTEVQTLVFAKPEAPKPDTSKTEPFKRVVFTPENITKIIPETPVRGTELRAPVVVDVIPLRGSSRYEQRSEIAARLNGQPKTAELSQAQTGSAQSKRAEIMSNLLKGQKVALADAMRIDPAARREMIANVLRSQTGGLAEMTAGGIQPAISVDTMKNGELTKPADLPRTISLKTIEQNLQAVRAVLAENNSNANQTEPQIPAKLAEQLITQPVVIDIQTVRELIAQQSNEKTNQPKEAAKPKSTEDAIKTLEQAKVDVIPAKAGIQFAEALKNENPANQTKLAPHIEAVVQLLQQPDQIIIHPEKRAEAIQLLTDLAQTKEYASNPKLQEQLKAVVQKEQERVIEHAEVALTAEKMMIAGIDQEVVAERLQLVVEDKKLPINEEQMAAIIQQAEARIAQGPRLIAENGLILEEEEDEQQKLLKKLQQLMIQLDKNVLENRFIAIFQALEQTWVTALEQGAETIEFARIIEILPSYEPIPEKSPIVEENDGSRVEAIKEIRSLGSFDNLDYARQALTNVLLNHLPGQVTTQVTTQTLTPEQVQEILQGGNYPSQMGQGSNIYNFPQANSQIFSDAT